MSKYRGTKYLVDNETGKSTLVDDDIEIVTNDLEEYMYNKQYFLLGKYDDKIIYTKTDYNRNVHRKYILKLVWMCVVFW